MKRNRNGNLKLHKETLRSLTARELGAVGGGDSTGSQTNGSAGSGSCSNLTTSCGCVVHSILETMQYVPYVTSVFIG
jgi:hypothetical protein